MPRRPRLSAWTLLKRVPLVLARLALELVPVLGIVLAGHLFAGSSLGGQTISRLIILAVVDSYAISSPAVPGAHAAVARSLPPAAVPSARCTATYLTRWARRLILIAVLGYAVGEVGVLLGLSDIAHDAMEKGVGLVAAFVWRTSSCETEGPCGAGSCAGGQTGMIARLRNRFAGIWHWVALFFLVAGWLVWAVEVPHGYAAVLHYFILTALD